MPSGSTSGPAGGCQLSSSSSGYGWTGRRRRARWRSIAALTAIRFSQLLTLPPRKPRGCGRRRRTPPGRRPRPGRVGHHPVDQAEERVLVDRDQIVERVEVAVARPLDEDRVAALGGVVRGRARALVLHLGRLLLGRDGRRRAWCGAHPTRPLRRGRSGAPATAQSARRSPRVGFAGPPVPKWRNRQTRRSQTPMPARASGFDPRLRHQRIPTAAAPASRPRPGLVPGCKPPAGPARALARDLPVASAAVRRRTQE